jgi:hypothetical protein
VTRSDEKGRLVQRSEIARWSLIAIAVLMIPAGLQAAFAPRSFFDDFPLGRGWISAGDVVYDEHLVRDAGALFLALIVVTLWSAWRREAMAGVAIAWLVQGVLHLGYHVGHLGGLGTADKTGLMVSLVLVPVLALVSLWASMSERRS